MDQATMVPGGTLSEYVKSLAAVGLQCTMADGGPFAWVPGAPGELTRLPLPCTDPVGGAEIRQLLSNRKVWVVSFLQQPDEAHPANCFFYVCRNQTYSLETLKKRVRASIRRGLEHLKIRLCTWDELAAKGYTAYADTDLRHGYAPPSQKNFQEFVNARRGSKFLDIWGAWAGDALAGWLTVLNVDNWAVFDAAKSATAFHNDSPNNALYFVITRTMLAEKKLSYVSCGLSSVQLGVDRSTLHRFKLSMGYEAMPLRRVFVARPLLRPLLRPRPAARLWEHLAKALPKYGIIGRIAGMSQVIAGLDRMSLAWATEDMDKL
ncbi:MAG: hypothetical protein MUP47_05585 [Phycisphaerae bacterium]|nr:hypothetical protein [Phycisphaerae bacterium]